MLFHLLHDVTLSHNSYMPLVALPPGERTLAMMLILGHCNEMWAPKSQIPFHMYRPKYGRNHGAGEPDGRGDELRLEGFWLQCSSLQWFVNSWKNGLFTYLLVVWHFSQFVSFWSDNILCQVLHFKRQFDWIFSFAIEIIAIYCSLKWIECKYREK